MQKDQQKRIKQFSKWWKNNKTHRPSHRWLTKHTLRCLHDYALAPEQWTVGKAIIKRYNLSEYKVLSRSNAWTLWRLTHPLHNERVERILATAMFYEEKRAEKG